MPAGPDRLPTRVSRLQEHTTPALICLATGPSQKKARPEIAEKKWQTFSQITRTTDKVGLPYPYILGGTTLQSMINAKLIKQMF